MRIVHVLTRFLRAGTEENTAITCNGQLAAGHDVTVIYGDEFSVEALQLLDAGVRQITLPCLRHPPSPVNDLRAVRELQKLYRSLRADVVHTHQSKAGAVGRLAAVLARVPHVVHGVHILPFMNAAPLPATVYKTIERLLGGRTHAFIHVTAALRDACIEARIGPKSEHAIVASGMNVDSFRTAAPAADDAAFRALIPGQSEPPVLFLMVAALERRKRHRELIEIFAQVVAEYPNVRLLLAGEGTEQANVTAQIERLGLSSHVMVLGLRGDVERLIATCDVGVLSSEREGLARCVIQYALGGRPILAPRLPGIERIVHEGENGQLCALEDLAGLKDDMLALARDPAARACMGQASKLIDLNDWDAGRMTARIMATYAAIGANPATTAPTPVPQL